MKIHDITNEAQGCWDGYKRDYSKKKFEKGSCVKENDVIDTADVGEYDQEGAMAIQDLAGAIDAADELKDILDSDDNLPEWVQAKITKALDYLDTSRDYMKHKDADEETYDGDEFYEAYGVLWFNEDEQLDEAEYQGRQVPLGKPIRSSDGPKKFHVFVKDGDKVKKVNFGDPNMSIKKSNPERRKSFRARHNCDNPGPRTKARYWSCRAW